MASQKGRRCWDVGEGVLCLQAVFQISKLGKIKQMFKSNVLNLFVAKYLPRKFLKLFASLVSID